MKLTIMLPLVKRRRRIHLFFLAGASLGAVMLLVSVLLGAQTIRLAHADTQQITEDIIECAIYDNGAQSDGGEQSPSAWNIVNGNENITSNGKMFPINGYTGPRGVTVSGSQPPATATDALSGSNQCDGYFLTGWDQQQNIWWWTYTFHNKPATDLCTARVYIPSWYAGATMAEYTLGNSLQQMTVATLNQSLVNGAFTTPQWEGQYAQGIPVGTDTGQSDVTLKLVVKSSGEAAYLAADAVDFRCTMTVTSASTPTPTPTPASQPQPGSTPMPIPTSTVASTPTATSTPAPTNRPTATPPPVSTPASSGLITNGSFEMGNPSPSNWTCNGGATTVHSPVHSGTRALQETYSNSTSSTIGQCTQTITVQPEHSYTLAAYIAGVDAHDSYVFLGVNDRSANWATKPGTSTWKMNLSTGYTKLTLPFTTGASQTSITVFVNGWNIDVDDVSVH